MRVNYNEFCHFVTSTIERRILILEDKVGTRKRADGTQAMPHQATLTLSSSP